MDSASILSIFKIGVGPSSSHTIGPIVAMNKFCDLIKGDLAKVARVKITLTGSLAMTGKGHLTDIACIIGLNNVTPKEVTPDGKEKIIKDAMENHKIKLCGEKEIAFDYNKDIVWNNTYLKYHPNGLIAQAYDENNNLIKDQVYYSTGGGFVSTEDEMKDVCKVNSDAKILKYDFNSAKRLGELCETYGKTIPEIVMLREKELHSEEFVREYCLEIHQAMVDCYENGINSKEEILPGGLNMKRLAPKIKERLSKTHFQDVKDPLALIDYVSMYARAIAEENASGGRVVTAPTNGACAVVPAVMLYVDNHLKKLSDDEIIDYILTCCAVGYLYKLNASISGAEAGCQAEIGAASSMAAAGMAFITGASTEETFNAAEIAMEHHLGLTCDPVNGLVQIPCIERNTLGSIKAISAVRLASDGAYGAPIITLDEVIETMYRTGKDMNEKYRETSLGGLAKIEKFVNC